MKEVRPISVTSVTTHKDSCGFVAVRGDLNSLKPTKTGPINTKCSPTFCRPEIFVPQF